MSRRPIVAGIRSRSEGGGDPSLRERLRETLARWASGVAVLAVRDEDEPIGMTVTAFSGLSLDPPLVLVCVREDAAILPALLEVGRFSINFLSERQRDAAVRFADAYPMGRDLFDDGDPPLVKGALATLACSLWQSHPGGDHRIVVGAVERLDVLEATQPLLYFNREYRTLP